MLDLRADIELPMAPDFSWSAIAAVLAVVALCAGALILIRYSSRRAFSETNSPGARIAELAQLRLQSQNRQCPPREAAYRLALILRSHFQLAVLDPASPPSNSVRPREWASTVNQLASNRYGRDASTLPDALFDRASAWLSATADGSKHDAVKK